MSWTLVDHNQSTTSNGLTNTTFTTAAALAGDLIAVWGHCSTGDPPAQPVSDTTNGTWPSAQNTVFTVNTITGSSGRLYFSWLILPANTSGLVVTVNGNASATRTFAIYEIWRSSFNATITTVDWHSQTGSSATPSSGATVGSAASGDLVLGGNAHASTGSPVTTAGSGYTLDQDIPNVFAAEYNSNATAGAQTATFTESVSVGWVASVVIFRATQIAIVAQILTQGIARRRGQRNRKPGQIIAVVPPLRIPSFVTVAPTTSY